MPKVQTINAYADTTWLGASGTLQQRDFVCLKSILEPRRRHIHVLREVCLCVGIYRTGFSQIRRLILWMKQLPASGWRSPASLRHWTSWTAGSCSWTWSVCPSLSLVVRCPSPGRRLLCALVCLAAFRVYSCKCKCCSLQKLWVYVCMYVCVVETKGRGGNRALSAVLGGVWDVQAR